jgi:hypothetical protein
VEAVLSHPAPSKQIINIKKILDFMNTTDYPADIMTRQPKTAQYD